VNWPAQCAVVIPCHNEAAAIGRLVSDVRRHLPAVIVVDDGSTDATAPLAEAAGATVLRQPKSLGKGAALATGWQYAVKNNFAWSLCMDGDGQHAPADIPKFLAAAQTVDLVIGNRMANPVAMPWLRRQVNRWMSRRLSNLVTGADCRSDALKTDSPQAGQTSAALPEPVFPDSQCGFRLIRLAALSSISLQTRHFEIESDLLVQFTLAGHRVEFVPIEVIYKAERSKIRPLLDSWRWLCWWRKMRLVVRSRQNRHPGNATVAAPVVS